MTNLNILRFTSTIARLNRHSLLIPNIALDLRYISRVTGYDAIYYVVPKCPIRNALENFPNHFDLGHFDELKFHEFKVLLTSLDSQRVALHISHPESC